jgi:hypothetical protein
VPRSFFRRRGAQSARQARRRRASRRNEGWRTSLPLYPRLSVASGLLLRPRPRLPRELHRLHGARQEVGQRRFLVRGKIQQRCPNRTGRPAHDAQGRLDDADRIAATLVPQREIGNEEAPHRFGGECAIARLAAAKTSAVGIPPT